jgi:hypothetical protein
MINNNTGKKYLKDVYYIYASLDTILQYTIAKSCMHLKKALTHEPV